MRWGIAFFKKVDHVLAREELNDIKDCDIWVYDPSKEKSNQDKKIKPILKLARYDLNHELTDEIQYAEAISSEDQTLITFAADIGSKRQPEFASFAAMHKEVKFREVDIAKPFGSSYYFEYLPTVKIYRNGTELATLKGDQTHDVASEICK